jgi:hypothetical protein
VSVGGAVEVSEESAAAHTRSTALRIDFDSIHPLKVDHDAAVYG